MKKKLIILINQSGTYKGGAQKRYLTLFSYLQKRQDEYYLLLNDSLYDSVFRDHILESTKNVLHLPVKFEKFENKNGGIGSNGPEINKKTVQKGRIHTYLGRIKYFIKCSYSCLCYSIKLNRLLKRGNFSSVYCVFNGGVWSWILFRIKKIDYIYSYNDANFGQLSDSCLNMWGSEYYPLKYAKQIDCLSPALSIGLQERFPSFHPDKFVITPNSFIDYTQFKPAELKENWICFCSRLEVLKNPYILIKAVSLIKDQMRGYQVMIIGYGNEYKHLEQGINKYNLEERVVLLGALESARSIVSKAKIFVSIQQHNNYPSQSVLEAMSCKNAIIASDVGETRLLVTDREGILIPLTAQDLANAMLLLIENDTLCKEKGEAARQKATMEHTVEKFAEYFNNLMDTYTMR